MMHKPRNRIQQQILDVLAVKSASVVDLTKELPVSAVYIRQQLLQLMDMELIEKVDNRQPFIYQKKALDLRKLHHMEAIEKALLIKDLKDIPDGSVKLKPVIAMIRNFPKAKWVEFAENMELIIEVIDKLNSEDKLIDTL